MKLLCKYLGGSHLYGLNHAGSDVDERGVFIHTDPLYVFGYSDKDNKTVQNDETDLVLHEFKQFLKLCAKSNTQTLECLFAPLEAFTELDQTFYDRVILNRKKLISTDVLYKSLCGYLHNERRLAIGERTGLLGGKRKAQLQKYGFSPKNIVHMIRLAESGRIFFETGDYMVRVEDFSHSLKDYLMQIKLYPESFDVNKLLNEADGYVQRMIMSYIDMPESRKLSPDLNLISELLVEFYQNSKEF